MQNLGEFCVVKGPDGKVYLVEGKSYHGLDSVLDAGVQGDLVCFGGYMNAIELTSGSKPFTERQLAVLARSLSVDEEGQILTVCGDIAENVYGNVGGNVGDVGGNVGDVGGNVGNVGGNVGDVVGHVYGDVGGNVVGVGPTVSVKFRWFSATEGKVETVEWEDTSPETAAGETARLTEFVEQQGGVVLSVETS